MIDWNKYHDQVRQGIAEIGRANPDIVRGYRMLSDAGKKTDLLGAKNPRADCTCCGSHCSV